MVFVRDNKPHLHLFNDHLVDENKYFNGENIEFLLKYYLLLNIYGAKISEFSEEIIQKEWIKRRFSETEILHLKEYKLGDETPI
jgi:hypothetical protein